MCSLFRSPLILVLNMWEKTFKLTYVASAVISFVTKPWYSLVEQKSHLSFMYEAKISQNSHCLVNKISSEVYYMVKTLLPSMDVYTLLSSQYLSQVECHDQPKNALIFRPFRGNFDSNQLPLKGWKCCWSLSYIKAFGQHVLKLDLTIFYRLACVWRWNIWYIYIAAILPIVW